MSFSVRRINDDGGQRRLHWGHAAVTLLKIAQPICVWYRQYKKQKEEEEHWEHRALLLKRILLILVAIFAALLLIAGTVKTLIAMRILKLDTMMSVAGADLPTDAYGFTNVLLLGQGDESHDGKDLTDTIIVASLDPKKTQSAILLSLPRDTFFLSTEKMGKGRINTFYRDYKGYLEWQKGMNIKATSVEALHELGQEIGRTLGMQIHHVIKIDFIAFAQVVDALGGIDVVVPEAIVDAEYPDEQYGYEPFSIAAGPQHLDGATALKYVRTRHTTSDFARSARQQQVLAAIGEKAKSEKRATDTAFITQMLRTYADHVETTLSIRETIGLAELGTKIDRERIITLQLNDRNALYDGFIEPGGFLYTPPRDQFEGAAVLLPVSIPEFPVTWKQPQVLMKLLMEYRDLYLANLRINVLNAGAKSGLARRLATELIRYGFTVGNIENAELPEKLPTSLIVPTNSEQQQRATALGNILHLPTGLPPPPLPPEQLGDLTIILGQDFTYTPLQDLLPSSTE